MLKNSILHSGIHQGIWKMQKIIDYIELYIE